MTVVTNRTALSRFKEYFLRTGEYPTHSKLAELLSVDQGEAQRLLFALRAVGAVERTETEEWRLTDVDQPHGIWLNQRVCRTCRARYFGLECHVCKLELFKIIPETWP